MGTDLRWISRARSGRIGVDYDGGRMTNWTISTKLFTLAAIGGVGSIAVLGWLSVTHGTSALLMEEAEDLDQEDFILAAALLSSMEMGSSMSEDKMRVMKGRGTPRCP